MKENAIILGNVACGKEAEYSNISYGKNVRCCRKERRMLTNNASDIIKLSNVKYNYVLILCNKKNCLYMFPQLSIISMSALYSNGKKEIADSGYLVLFAGSTKATRKGNFEMNWGKNDFRYLKICKKNIIKKNNNHHESTGHYFSFGNRANFLVENDSSVCTYKSRTSHGPYEQRELDDMAIEYDMKCSQQLQIAHNILCNIFPLTKLLVQPILSAAHHCSKVYNEKSPLTETKGYDCGLWASCICVNAETKKLHTEHDCTYTLIFAPQQNKTLDKYEFNFCLNPRNNVCFDMNDGISFMFSGMFLKHKQHKWKHGNNNDLFFNFASYGNQRLFNHIKHTLMRTTNNHII